MIFQGINFTLSSQLIVFDYKSVRSNDGEILIEPFPELSTFSKNIRI